MARVTDTVVINSGYEDLPGVGLRGIPNPYRNIGTQAYFTDQINEVLTYFRNGEKQIAYIIVADTKLVNATYQGLLIKALHYYNNLTAWAMYCPWEIGKRPFPKETSVQHTTGVYEIPKAYNHAPDLGHCLIHKKLLNLMPARWDTNVNKFGWGIDRLYADKARAKGWSVLLDTNYNVDHVPGTGYNKGEALQQHKKFRERYKNYLRYDITWQS